jgi:hypothetical protein
MEYFAPPRVGWPKICLIFVICSQIEYKFKRIEGEALLGNKSIFAAGGLWTGPRMVEEYVATIVSGVCVGSSEGSVEND